MHKQVDFNLALCLVNLLVQVGNRVLRFVSVSDPLDGINRIVLLTYWSLVSST